MNFRSTETNLHSEHRCPWAYCRCPWRQNHRSSWNFSPKLLYSLQETVLPGLAKRARFSTWKWGQCAKVRSLWKCGPPRYCFLWWKFAEPLLSNDQIRLFRLWSADYYRNFTHSHALCKSNSRTEIKCSTNVLELVETWRSGWVLNVR